ncbi:hypothetical protein Tco_0969127 [Tanacetum coccineum]
MAVVVAWVRCDDDGGMMMMMVVGLVGCGCWREGGEKWRVAASGSGDRVHRVVGSLFGLAGKIPPENFSGGGSGGRRWGDPPEKKKMRMEQCIDYTLWEIIENGNAPIVTKLVDGKETAIPPTTVKEKAQRRA